MTDDTPIPVRVVFRRWRGEGGVIALFPELPADARGYYCDSYEPVGQNGGADYHGVVRHTAPATPEESAASPPNWPGSATGSSPSAEPRPDSTSGGGRRPAGIERHLPRPDTGRVCVTSPTHPGERRWPSASAP